jgi:hypothetical protein
LNGLAVFKICPPELNPLTGETLDKALINAAENLKIAVREAREQRNTRVMLKDIGFSLLASAFFYLVCRLVYWGERVITRHLQRWLAGYETKLAVAIHSQQLINPFIFLIHFAKKG